MGRWSNRGFTLIELMIAVVIIGILAAIAIPNFFKLQARAKQSEAKNNLKGFYTAALSYQAINDDFNCGFCNWEPHKLNRYTYFDGNGNKYPRVGTSDATCGTAPATVGIAGAPAPAFTVGATANIDADMNCDEWTVDDGNQLRNVTNDVSQ